MKNIPSTVYKRPHKNMLKSHPNKNVCVYSNPNCINYICLLMSRSVVVVCKNMNATDIERLVPGLALSGCSKNNNKGSDSSGLKGHCVELAKNGGKNCTGEPDLCQVFKEEFIIDVITTIYK